MITLKLKLNGAEAFAAAFYKSLTEAPDAPVGAPRWIELGLKDRAPWIRAAEHCIALYRTTGEQP
jgi:hypothetical protein